MPKFIIKLDPKTDFNITERNLRVGHATLETNPAGLLDLLLQQQYANKKRKVFHAGHSYSVYVKNALGENVQYKVRLENSIYREAVRNKATGKKENRLFSDWGSLLGWI